MEEGKDEKKEESLVPANYNEICDVLLNDLDKDYERTLAANKKPTKDIESTYKEHEETKEEVEKDQSEEEEVEDLEGYVTLEEEDINEYNKSKEMKVQYKEIAKEPIKFSESIVL